MNELTDRTGQIALDQPPATGDIQASKSVDIASFNPAVRSHLERIYNSLDASQKENFLHGIQNESHACSSASEPADHLASLPALQAYMAGSASSALRPALKKDLSAPITDYFISSSHNTYLTGNQLYSEAAANAYTNVSLSDASGNRWLHGFYNAHPCFILAQTAR
jgi:hypothetical protein